MADDLFLRITQLEEKFVHQERYLDNLNEVVVEQQKQIDGLLEEVRRLRELLADREQPGPSGQEPPPPHY